MKILIIEDEIKLAENIVKYFHKEKYICELATSYMTAIDKIILYTYDCILLDISLPDGNGLKLLKLLKQQDKKEGVIIISARDSIDDKVSGLLLGADDYLAKPFHMSELSARVIALIRRRNFEGKQEIHIGDLQVDLSAKEVFVRDKKLELTRKELELLLFFISNKGSVISKEAIAEHLSGDDIEVLASLDFIYSHIKNLKKKLSEVPSALKITSHYGLGYKLIAYTDETAD